jgi:hypothetical protein
MTSKLTRVLVAAAMGAGAVGVILALAGVHSPVRTGLVLLFLAVAPTAAIAGLLRNFDSFARLILAVASTVAVLTILAVILLAAGLWSPVGELLGVAAITVACLAAQRPAVRARVAAWARRGWHALLRPIASDRTAVPRVKTAPAGAVADNGQAAPHGEAAAQVPGSGHVKLLPAEAVAQVPGNGQADVDTAEIPVIGQSELDRAEVDAAEVDAAEVDAAGAETASPTEDTTPLPAIRD